MEGAVPEVAGAIAALYGRRPLIGEGVVHVTSAARGPDGRLHVLKIGASAPKSETDFFVLNLCRARCDAILTTAANLRAEPQLQHVLQGPWAAALARYRRGVLRKLKPPLCAILTGSGALPRAHPVWDDSTEKLVLTSEATAPALRWMLGGQAEVVAIAGLDARRACRFLQERGHALISVEAGPSTTRTLYEAPSCVDELLLSVYEEPVTDAQLGRSLPEDAALFADKRCLADTQRSEQSGSWRFQRWAPSPAA